MRHPLCKREKQRKVIHAIYLRSVHSAYGNEKASYGLC